MRTVFKIIGIIFLTLGGLFFLGGIASAAGWGAIAALIEGEAPPGFGAGLEFLTSVVLFAISVTNILIGVVGLKASKHISTNPPAGKESE